MQIDFLSVLFTVFSLVILAVPGYIAIKTKILNAKGADVLSSLVLYIAQPAMLFMSFQKTKYDPNIALNLLYVALLTIATHLIMILLVSLIIHKDADEKKNKIKKVVKYASVFGNCGYMGLPFLQMLFSGAGNFQNEILIYGGAVISIFNLMSWSIGVFMISGDKKQVSVKKMLLNPNIIAILLGLILFLFVKTPLIELTNEGTTLNSVLTKLTGSINLIADMVTPLSMIVIGIKLANVNFKKLFTNLWVYYSCALKLIAMSIISMLIVSFLPVSTIVKYAVFFTMSMPSATSTAMFAIKFDADGEFASIVVLLSTVLSILTIPLMFLVITNFFGVVI